MQQLNVLDPWGSYCYNQPRADFALPTGRRQGQLRDGYSAEHWNLGSHRCCLDTDLRRTPRISERLVPADVVHQHRLQLSLNLVTTHRGGALYRLPRGSLVEPLRA